MERAETVQTFQPKCDPKNAIQELDTGAVEV